MGKRISLAEIKAQADQEYPMIELELPDGGVTVLHNINRLGGKAKDSVLKVLADLTRVVDSDKENPDVQAESAAVVKAFRGVVETLAVDKPSAVKVTEFVGDDPVLLGVVLREVLGAPEGASPAADVKDPGES